MACALGVSRERGLRSVESTEEVFLRLKLHQSALGPRRELPAAAHAHMFCRQLELNLPSSETTNTHTKKKNAFTAFNALMCVLT